MSGAICGAVIGGAMGFSNGAKSVRKANKKVIKAFNKELSVMSRQYSYAQNELDKQAVYERDRAVSEMYQLSLNSLRNNALVEVALGESGLEGRSQKAVARDVRGQSERQKDNIQSSYENAIYSIKSQKDSLHVEYSQNAKNLHDQYQAQITKGWKAFWQISDATAQGAAMGYFGGALGGSFLSGATGAVAGSSAGTGLTAGATGASAGLTGAGSSTLGGAGAATLGGGSSFGLLGSAGASGASSSALSSVGVGAVSGASGSWGSVGTLANSGLASSTASRGFSWSGGWANMMNNWSTYYNNMNRYMNYYKTFRSYVGTPNQDYRYTNRRRGMYY